MLNKSKNLILLGDAKGTKYLMKNDPKVLCRNMATIHEAFSKTFMYYYQSNRYLECFTLSDSFIAKWIDYKEGLKYCLSFAFMFWKEIEEIPFRIFIDFGESFDSKTGYGNIMNQSTSRYTNILPISFPIWSVSEAESKHFPEGVFISENVAKYCDSYCNVGKYSTDNFEYIQVK